MSITTRLLRVDKILLEVISHLVAIKIVSIMGTYLEILLLPLLIVMLEVMVAMDMVVLMVHHMPPIMPNNKHLKSLA